MTTFKYNLMQSKLPLATREDEKLCIAQRMNYEAYANQCANWGKYPRVSKPVYVGRVKLLTVGGLV